MKIVLVEESYFNKERINCVMTAGSLLSCPTIPLLIFKKATQAENPNFDSSVRDYMITSRFGQLFWFGGITLTPATTLRIMAMAGRSFGSGGRAGPSRICRPLCCGRPVRRIIVLGGCSGYTAHGDTTSVFLTPQS